jgi:hypothetical protein
MHLYISILIPHYLLICPFLTPRVYLVSIYCYPMIVIYIWRVIQDMCMFRRRYISIYIYIYKFNYHSFLLYIYTYIYIHTYIHIYIFIHLYVYIHIHIHSFIKILWRISADYLQVSSTASPRSRFIAILICMER